MYAAIASPSGRVTGRLTRMQKRSNNRFHTGNGPAPAPSRLMLSVKVCVCSGMLPLTPLPFLFPGPRGLRPSAMMAEDRSVTPAASRFDGSPCPPLEGRRCGRDTIWRTRLLHTTGARSDNLGGLPIVALGNSSAHRVYYGCPETLSDAAGVPHERKENA